MDILTRTKPDYVADPSYSPDGTKIVFVEKIGSAYKISTIDPSGGNYIVLQTGANAFADPYFSPNGSLIVYALQTGAVSGPNPYGLWAIHYMHADGTGVTTIVDNGNANIHPCWVNDYQVGFQYWQYGVSTAFRVGLIDIAGQGRTNIGVGEYPRAVAL